MLTRDDLRYGSPTLLSKLTGLHASQFSGWFNDPNLRISLQNLERLSEATGLSLNEVKEVLDERRLDTQNKQNANRRIKDVIKSKKKPNLIEPLGVAS